MAATRKRKSTRTPVKSKKVKAEEEEKVKAEEEEKQPEEEQTEEEKQHPADGSPKDEHTAAAEALKALCNAADVVAEGEEKGSDSGAYLETFTALSLKRLWQIIYCW